MKIGIMGGTFNPIHMGHLLLAENARESYSLDRILFIPSGVSYMKDQNSILDKEERYAMCRLAVKDNPYFEVSRIEMDRPGNTYTCDTLRTLEGERPQDSFYFLLGADSLAGMEQWKQPAYIFAGTVVLAAVREGYPMDALNALREKLRETYQADIRFLTMRNIDISSTEIRKRLEAGNSVRYMIPETVYSYLTEHQLYQRTGNKHENC